jgi:uncharacterized membrane protein
VFQGKGLYSAISVNSGEILSRGPPRINILNAAVVAALSGVAVALGMSSGISSALAGVALSTSLLPPIVNCGKDIIYTHASIRMHLYAQSS